MFKKELLSSLYSFECPLEFPMVLLPLPFRALALSFHLHKPPKRKQIIKGEILSEAISRVFLLLQIWNVNYCTSKVQSNILSNENKKTGVSRKIVCFDNLIHVLS